jgi:hypothetical protein
MVSGNGDIPVYSPLLMYVDNSDRQICCRKDTCGVPSRSENRCSTAERRGLDRCSKPTFLY